MKKYKVGDLLIWRNYQWNKDDIGRRCKVIKIEESGGAYDYRIQFLGKDYLGDILPVYEKELSLPSKLELALK